MGRNATYKSEENVTLYHRKSIPKDILAVADNMREEDVAECKAQSGSNPRESLFFCYFHSNPCRTIVSRHGNPIGMYGVVPEGLKWKGWIWMLGCQSMFDDISDKLAFLRQSKEELPKLLKQYPLLFNVVDARNTVHIHWLKWMGFTFINKHSEWGPENRPFYEFVRI